MATQRILIYGSNVRFPLPEYVQTIDEAKAAVVGSLPQIRDAEGRVDSDGNFVFEKKAGTKGL